MTEHADTVGLGYGGSCNSQTLSQEQQVLLNTIIVTIINTIINTLIFTMIVTIVVINIPIFAIIIIGEKQMTCLNELCIELHFGKVNAKYAIMQLDS